MLEPKPYKLFNKIQNYEWGTRGKDAFIPELLGQVPEVNIPYAELWIGAHPKAPSEVEINGERIPLNILINKYPQEILGSNFASKFNNELPYLFKVLSAGEPLSIQAHPSKEQAKVLHKNDPVNYPDENHKPEIAITLDRLKALVGFREIEKIKEVVTKYSAFKEIINESVYNEFVNSEFLTVNDASKGIKVLYSHVIKMSIEDSNRFKSLIESLRKEINHKPDELNEEELLFLEMFEKYGYDIGLISILFFNLVTLEKGEAIFTPAGLPHAYIGGNIIECMANSDNVIRAGLTPKFKDINNLLELMDYTPGEPKLVEIRKNKNEYKYITPSEEFKVCKIELRKGDLLKLQNNQPAVILITQGEAVIEFNSGRLKLSKGESVLLPALMKEYAISSNTFCELFTAAISL